MGTALHKFTCIKMLTMILWILAFLLFNVNVVVGNADGYCGKSSDGSANAIVIELKTDQQFNEDVDWKEGYTEGYQYKTGVNDGVICYLKCHLTDGYQIKKGDTGAIPFTDCKDPSKTTRSSDH